MQLRNRTLTPAPLQRRATNPHVMSARTRAPRPSPLFALHCSSNGTDSAAPVAKTIEPAQVPTLASYVSSSATAFVSVTLPSEQSSPYLTAQGVYWRRMHCSVCHGRAMFVYLFTDYRARSLCSVCGPSRQYAVATSLDTMRAFHRWLDARRQIDAQCGEVYTVDCSATEIQPRK